MDPIQFISLSQILPNSSLLFCLLIKCFIYEYSHPSTDKLHPYATHKTSYNSIRLVLVSVNKISNDVSQKIFIRRRVAKNLERCVGRVIMKIWKSECLKKDSIIFSFHRRSQKYCIKSLFNPTSLKCIVRSTVNTHPHNGVTVSYSVFQLTHLLRNIPRLNLISAGFRSFVH